MVLFLLQVIFKHSALQPLLKHKSFYMANESEKFELSDDEKKLVEEMISDYENGVIDFGVQRRQFLKQITAITGTIVASQLFGGSEVYAHILNDDAWNEAANQSIENGIKVSFKVNGVNKSLELDSRMTLLDTLRERLHLTGSKKGCDHGQCGACTVIVDGRRVLSCLTLAVTCQGKKVTTIEGLAKGDQLHPVQAAFLKHDGFQCGYCTPGQICSTVALMTEIKNGDASYVTADIRTKPAPLQLSDEEIRERMSGNICRCGAYQNIVSAIRELHTGKEVAQAWQFAGYANASVANQFTHQTTNHETI